MKTVVMCIGNTLNAGDDAVGPYLAKLLVKEKIPDYIILDCGTAPENFTSIVKREKPDRVIIIDAMDMNLEEGSLRLVPADKIGIAHISTHGIPLSILASYLKSYVKEILFIGIQPKKMHGEKLSEPVREAAKKLVNILKGEKLGEIEVL